jgi:VRR-NUC domain-containing protein
MSSQGGDHGEAHTQVVQAIRQYFDWCKAWNLKVVGGAYQRRGVPDILACWPDGGRLIAVEVKTGKGRLTADQETELAALLKSGAVCIVASSVDDVEEVLIKLELLTEPLVVSREQAAAWRAAQRPLRPPEETQVE